MQTALLSLGIAIIVVLVAALVGPPLIDWGYYRAAVEARASGLAGVPVRVGGPITVRLLPTLSLKLSDVEIGEAGSPRNVKAHTVAMEFSLGALMRGEVQARDVAVDGPEIMAALDQSGHVEMFAFSPGFDPDRFGIEHFTVGNGRLTLIDAASGGRLAIDNIVLSGSANSLAGPFKAEGSFAQNGERFGYRISASRRGSDGGTKFRLAIDANERALTFESNGAVWVENGSPRYEGAMTLSRSHRYGGAGSSDHHQRSMEARRKAQSDCAQRPLRTGGLAIWAGSARHLVDGRRRLDVRPRAAHGGDACGPPNQSRSHAPG